MNDEAAALDARLRWAQELVRQYVPSSESLAEELMSERRDEAARE